MRKFKLIKKYPGLFNSMEIGTIIVDTNPCNGAQDAYFSEDYGSMRSKGYILGADTRPSKFPEFWEEIKHEFKVGDWSGYCIFYNNKSYKTIFLIGEMKTSIDGITTVYCNTGIVRCNLSSLIDVTSKEVDEYLCEEAEKKYPAGTRFKSLNAGVVYMSNGKSRIMDSGKEIAMYLKDQSEWESATCYKNGEWAEIEKDELKIGTWPVTFESYQEQIGKPASPTACASTQTRTKVKVRCRTYLDSEVKTLRQQLEFFGIDSIEINGNKISKETIDKIWEKLK